jgi:hypothetical protein
MVEKYWPVKKIHKTVESNKEEFKRMMLAGEPKPASDSKLYHLLLNYCNFVDLLFDTAEPFPETLSTDFF